MLLVISLSSTYSVIPFQQLSDKGARVTMESKRVGVWVSVSS